MKTFINVNPRDVRHALTVIRQTRQDGHTATLSGGGSDVLQLMKERIITPDVLINLKAIGGMDQVK
jgi:CO/xanthine dehydrogenase FAD-binding subunit